jgi:hypothetical protein
MIYFAYFHLIINYGVISGGNSSYSVKIFTLQKKVLRTITGLRNRDSCHAMFKDLNILTFTSQYIFSVLCFVVSNRDDLVSVSDLHNMFTRQTSNFHQPVSNLLLYQRGIFSMGIKLYHKLPPSIKNASNNGKSFKSLLKKFLYLNLFYTLDEYYNYIHS